MTAQLPKPAPQPDAPVVFPDGRPQQTLAQWISTLDTAVRSFFGAPSTSNTAGAPVVGALVAAVDDAAAAAAGVPISGLYRNGSVVQIRVT